MNCINQLKAKLATLNNYKNEIESMDSESRTILRDVFVEINISIGNIERDILILENKHNQAHLLLNKLINDRQFYYDEHFIKIYVKAKDTRLAIKNIKG